VDEAIAVFRSNMQPDGRRALKHFALLLARHGREDEAVGLLLPHLDDWGLAAALVEVSVGLGRDEEIASLLAARVETGCQCGRPDCGGRNTRPGNAIDLLAAVRERQGRVDEAIALLRTRQITSVNGRDQLADLLARHDRIEELREYAGTEPLGDAAQCLAEYLEQRGDVAGAIDVYRTLAPDDMPHTAVRLSWLLARHGQGDEAIELLCSLPSAAGGDEDWVVDALCTLYTDQGRPEDGLAYLDDLRARVVSESGSESSSESSSEPSEFFRLRTKLLVACGRREQAIQEARARPGSADWYEAQNLATLLSDAGRPEEAVAILEPTVPANRNALAAHLMTVGRIEDSVALLRQTVKNTEPRPWSSGSPPLTLP
jgi:tetratricopeptide (TPR) repeat protein